MLTRRQTFLSVGVLGAFVLTLPLAGCGGGSTQETLPTGEVKVQTPVGSQPVSEEYKNGPTPTPK
jgi:hypothetical protein